MHLNKQMITTYAAHNYKRNNDMNFETIIGLECHVEFKNWFKNDSLHHQRISVRNQIQIQIVIDWGYPGVLPVVNKRALEFGMRAALALNCTISQDTKFDRKNYFYPDNPKRTKSLNSITQSVMMAGLISK